MTNLPPEVEEALEMVEECYEDWGCGDGCCGSRRYNHLDEADLLRRHITTQAEEIGRRDRMMVAIAEEHPQPAEMLFRERKLNETLLDMTTERDRYKAMAKAWEGMANIVAREGGCEGFLASLIDSPLSPVGRLKAAEEATR